MINAAHPYDKHYLLRLIREGILTEVEPALPEGRARLILQTACELLDDVAADVQPGEARLPDKWRAQAEMLADLQGRALPRGVELEQDERILACLAFSIGQHPSRDNAPVLQSMQSALDHQEAVHASLPSLQSGYEFSARGGLSRQAPADIPMTALLADYLRARGPLINGARHVSVRRLSAGSSKDTFLASLEEPRSSLVIRKDGAFSSLGTTVRDEYPLFNFLSGFDLPVPTVLHAELDSGPCRSPFLVFKTAPGSPGPLAWGDDEAVRSVALQLAEFLARLHAVPIEQFRQHPPEWLSPMHLCRSVAGMVAFWRRIKFRPEPIMEAICAWLQVSEPSAAGRQVLVHGDAAFHNLLVEEGRLTAVLDWENAHLGRPEEDLGYVRPFVSKVMRWEEFLEAYHRHGGVLSSTDNERFCRHGFRARHDQSVQSAACGARGRSQARHEGCLHRYALRAALHARNPEKDHSLNRVTCKTGAIRAADSI